MGLQPLKLKRKNSTEEFLSFNFKFLILNFLLIVGLGLAIFAVLPRFPGYQLRTFPVSSPIQVKGNFTGRSIINPGYVRQGNGNNQGSGNGTNKMVNQVR